MVQAWLLLQVLKNQAAMPTGVVLVALAEVTPFPNQAELVCMVATVAPVIQQLQVASPVVEVAALVA